MNSVLWPCTKPVSIETCVSVMDLGICVAPSWSSQCLKTQDPGQDGEGWAPFTPGLAERPGLRTRGVSLAFRNGLSLLCLTPPPPH